MSNTYTFCKRATNAIASSDTSSMMFLCDESPAILKLCPLRQSSVPPSLFFLCIVIVWSKSPALSSCFLSHFHFYPPRCHHHLLLQSPSVNSDKFGALRQCEQFRCVYKPFSSQYWRQFNICWQSVHKSLKYFGPVVPYRVLYYVPEERITTFVILQVNLV